MRSNLSRAKVEPSDGARKLQERLHQLLSRLSATIEVVKTWRESDGDDIAIHRTTTTRLMGSVMEVLEALKRVEGVVKADQELRKALQNCPVALDLLVLLDHGGGLNPGTLQFNASQWIEMEVGWRDAPQMTGTWL